MTDARLADEEVCDVCGKPYSYDGPCIPKQQSSETGSACAHIRRRPRADAVKGWECADCGKPL